MNDWIPFHRSLMKGRKRALPRATRFIFLELCVEAREGGGLIELAPGLSPGEAVLDLIGGNRREVHAAMDTLVAEDMVDIVSRPGFLVITTWDRWKLKDRTNAERQARFRERKSNGVRNARVTPQTVTPPLPEVTPLDQIREDQRREEDLTRAYGAPTAAAPAKTNGKTTDADFDAEVERAREAEQRAKARVADASPPVPLSAAILKNDSKKASSG